MWPSGHAIKSVIFTALSVVSPSSGLHTAAVYAVVVHGMSCEIHNWKFRETPAGGPRPEAEPELAAETAVSPGV